MNKNNVLTLVEKDNMMKEVRETPITTFYSVDMREVKSYVKEMKFLEGKSFSFAPMLVLGTVDMSKGGAGIMWDTFLKYIFPWMLDIAKVFCAIKIAQGFYNEHRGGQKDGTGWSSLVSNGKWLIFFHLLPFFVGLVDGIGASMVNGLQTNPIGK
jgi:hypothetical protein